MIEPMNIIVVDRATPPVINAVHEAIKQKANGWWHRLTDVWLVGGDLTPTQWRDYLAPYVTSPAGLLVLRLPSEQTERLWAMRGPDSTARAEWIKRNYRK